MAQTNLINNKSTIFLASTSHKKKNILYVDNISVFLFLRLNPCSLSTFEQESHDGTACSGLCVYVTSGDKNQLQATRAARQNSKG